MVIVNSAIHLKYLLHWYFDIFFMKCTWNYSPGNLFSEFDEKYFSWILYPKSCRKTDDCYWWKKMSHWQKIGLIKGGFHRGHGMSSRNKSMETILIYFQCEPQDGTNEDAGSSCAFDRRLSVSSSTTTDTQVATGSGRPPILRRRTSSLRGFTRNLMNLRRASRAFGMVAGPVRAVQEKPQPKLENTYKMKPDPHTEFRSGKVTEVIQEVLASYLEKMKYDQKRINIIVRDLATHIKSRVKDMMIPRYKIVCNIVLGQSQSQGFHETSQCLWDTSTDNWACASYKNDSIFAVATVHAVYYEWDQGSVSIYRPTFQV